MQPSITTPADAGALAGYAARVLRGEVQPPPIVRTLGFTLVSLAPGHAVVAYEVKLDQHANPMGTLHGGILCDLADLAMGVVYDGTPQEGESFTTVELATDFLRPVWQGCRGAKLGPGTGEPLGDIISA